MRCSSKIVYESIDYVAKGSIFREILDSELSWLLLFISYQIELQNSSSH